MHYLPEIAIVNNIEFDHADIYRNLEDIKFEFSRLMNLVPANGHLIVGIDSPVAKEVLDEMDDKLFTNLETFGTTGDAKWQARYIDVSGEMIREPFGTSRRFKGFSILFMGSNSIDSLFFCVYR